MSYIVMKVVPLSDKETEVLQQFGQALNAARIAKKNARIAEAARNEAARNQAFYRLAALASSDDTEMAHKDADDVLVTLLDTLGYSDVTAAYEKIKKWYA